MTEILRFLEASLASLPLSFLEAWGRVSYGIGLLLAILAFGGFTFRLGADWGFGRERQAWDAKAFLSMPLTFVIVFVAGYVGSFVVLVPGAQTFESLKDLCVFVCITLFGYPALITVPFAYGLSDLVEGVPPDFLLDWLTGYFINPACFWVAYQLLGKDPDFRRPIVWAKYAGFVASFLLLEPVLWGFICSGKFTAAIAYLHITSALFFTTGITWLLAPVAMLAALPLARRFGLFWAEIDGHVEERRFGEQAAAWVAGDGAADSSADSRVPLRMFILMPFLALVLGTVAATAYMALSSAERDENKLAVRLHEEISENINLRLDAYLATARDGSADVLSRDLTRLLGDLPIAHEGRALILDGHKRVIAASSGHDALIDDAIQNLRATLLTVAFTDDVKFRFDHVSVKPLARETWLACATRYQDLREDRADWVLLTLMPEAFYLAGVRAGNSRSAMVFAIALLLALAIAGALSAFVSAPLRRISNASRELARGAVKQRVPGSRLKELNQLAQAFDHMAEQLSRSFGELVREVEVRKRREQELEQSEARLRESEDRLQLATRAADLGIWDWDVENDRLIWDDSMYRLYGLSKEQFGGAYEAWLSCVEPEDFARATDDVEAALRGDREFQSEFRVRQKDGSIRFVRGVGQTLRAQDGRPRRMVGVNWDITERRLAQQALQRHQNDLEALVQERTHALNDAKEQADLANRAKSQFLAHMSHEIRTPMNVILGFGQLMERQSELSPRDRDRLGKIMASGRHLLALLNNVLEMSKIEAGGITLDVAAFELPTLLEDVRSIFADWIAERGNVLVFEVDPRLPRVVEGDASKVKQVLMNLVGNAAKLTDRGRITVRAEAELVGMGDWRVRIAVSDTGPGIDADGLARIFTAFHQSSAGARSGGTGLGLTISRTFARLMNGDVTVTSRVGEGSTFTFAFRVRALSRGGRAPMTSRVPAALEMGQRHPRVLIVDDEAVNRELLEDLLGGLGFDTRSAANAEQAFALHAIFLPELVLMDLRMEDIDGLTAMRRLREAGSKAAFITLTASAVAEAERDAREAGADAFLRKPYRESELLSAVASALGIPMRAVPEPASAAAPRDEPIPAVALSELMSELPRALLEELRDATRSARAERLRALVGQAKAHSDRAGREVERLSVRFEYDVLLNAFEQVLQ